MPTIITEKCEVLFLMPCPACNTMFDKAEGVFVTSETVGDSVLICQKHSGQKALTVKEEVCIQDCLKRTVDSSDGWVSVGQRTIKKNDIMERYNIT